MITERPTDTELWSLLYEVHSVLTSDPNAIPWGRIVTLRERVAEVKEFYYNQTEFAVPLEPVEVIGNVVKDDDLPF